MSNFTYFANLDLPNGVTALQSPTLAGAQPKIEAAQSFTLSVEKFFLNKRVRNRRRRNPDLTVVSRVELTGADGPRPPVDKVHLMLDDHRPKRLTEIGTNNVIWATDDWTAAKAEQIELSMYLIDRDQIGAGLKQGLSTVFDVVSTSFGAAFPVFAPFAGITSDVADNVVEFIDKIDTDDVLFESFDRLWANGTPGSTTKILQPGHYVICDQPLLSDGVDAPGAYALNSRMELMHLAGQRQPVTDVTYIVLKAVPRYLPAAEYQAGEAAATLLRELHDARSKGADVLNFVSQTFGHYDSFKKIERFHELTSKVTLTESEQKLLDELKGDTTISTYLPQS